MIPPAARTANTGNVVPTPVGSAAARRAISVWEFGPGTAVTKWRDWGSDASVMMPNIVSGPTFFSSAEEWRSWLAQHHETATECLVGFVKVTTGETNLSWSESVDQALCFGWIDGVRRRIDDRTYSIRFTPRKPGSIWSAINVKKMAALEASGLMTAAGRAAFAARRDAKTAVYAYEKAPAVLAEADKARFEADAAAWEFFQRQAPWYRRNAIYWVTSAKREDTREKRLAQLINDSAAGRRLRHLSR
jgi:uncharacterized protein YdeI (YjbR/CyaY-like superfamily)